MTCRLLLSISERLPWWFQSCPTLCNPMDVDLQASQFSSIHSLSCLRLFVTPWTAAHQDSLSITNSWSLLKLMSIELVMPSLPLSSPSPPASSFSQHQGLFQWVSFCIRWPKYWSFSFRISPSNEYLGLIYFRIDWFDLLVVLGTLKSLLQHHS